MLGEEEQHMISCRGGHQEQPATPPPPAGTHMCATGCKGAASLSENCF